MAIRFELAMHKATRMALLCLGIGQMALVCCDEPTSSPSVGSNSNWLTACVADTDCSAGLGCNCGACSRQCASDADCRGLSASACITPSDAALDALCGGPQDSSGPGICLPPCEPGSCDESHACSLGACVPLRLPNVEFCSGGSAESITDRTQEDDLVLAVELVRQSGAIGCGSTSVSGPLNLVRLDSRLTCAARVLAQDIAATGSHSLSDSAGRGTTDRLALTGYSPRFWVEGYAWDVASASSALQVMLKDTSFCNGFVATTLTDIGVGYAQSVYVVTVASQ